MNARIYVFHATGWEGIPFLTPPTRLTLAYGYQPERVEDMELERIFRQNNAVDGTEWNCQYGARSLSVGDVVMIDDSVEVTAWLVDVIGWRYMHPHHLPELLGWTEVTA